MALDLVRKHEEKGVTLMEMMLVVAITTLLILGFVGFNKITARVLYQSADKVELMREAHGSFQLVSQLMMEADGSTIIVDQANQGTPWSRIQFKKAGSSDTTVIYQQGSDLYFQNGSHVKKLCTHMKRVFFLMPRHPSDKGSLQLSMTYSRMRGAQEELLTLTDTIHLLNPEVRNLDRGI